MDSHIELNVMQQQIDNEEVVSMQVAEVGVIDVKLVDIIEEDFRIRIPDILPDGGSVVVHIHVVDH